MPKLNSEASHSLGQENINDRMRGEAMLGDIQWSISPSTLSTSPTSEAWTRKVLVKAVNSDGETHKWVNTAISSGVSIADTSSAGTASITSTTLTLSEGVAVVTVSGDAEDWLGGTAQEKAITVTGAPSSSGTVTFAVTAAGMDNSPKDVEVELDHTTMTNVTLTADAIVTALEADSDVSSFFTVDNTAGKIVLTAITPAANDATMDIAFTDTDTTNATCGASADETAGVAKETDTLTVAEEVIAGVTMSAVTSVETFED